MSVLGNQASRRQLPCHRSTCLDTECWAARQFSSECKCCHWWSWNGTLTCSTLTVWAKFMQRKIKAAGVTLCIIKNRSKLTAAGFRVYFPTLGFFVTRPSSCSADVICITRPERLDLWWLVIKVWLDVVTPPTQHHEPYSYVLWTFHCPCEIFLVKLSFVWRFTTCFWRKSDVSRICTSLLDFTPPIRTINSFVKSLHSNN